MQESHKKNFWVMVNVAMELTNHPPLSKEAIVTWWHLLNKYEYETVESAIDKWVKEMTKPPTPNDILKLCQHKVSIHARLPSPLAKEDSRQHSAEVMDYLAKNIKPKRDYRAWAENIIANPSKYPDISIKLAKEALALPVVYL